MRSFRPMAVAAWAALSIVTLSAAPSGAEDRATKILANLKLNIPQLAELNPTIGTISPSGIQGLDEGSFTVNGQSYPFLVTSDDKKLWMIQGDPLDVSKGEAEVQAELAKRAEQEKKEAAERQTKLAASVAGRPFRGKEGAKVTIVEFSDFECPFCARGAATMEEVLAKYPDDVKFVFYHFPLPFHPWAKPAAVAANCAAEQDPAAFWTLHDKYFEHQKELTPGDVVAKSKGYLAGSKVDLAKWEKCAGDTSSEEYKAQLAKVDADLAFGQSLGVSGTPGFFVNGELVSGAQPIGAFAPLIEKAKGGA